MPTIRIPPGVVRTETRAMVLGRWHEANLIRWQNGRMQPVGGSELITKNPLLSVPRKTHVWLDDDASRLTAVLCDDAVFREENGIFYDITPVDFLDANSIASKGYGSGDYGRGNYGSDEEDRGQGDNNVATGSFDPSLKVRFAMDNWNTELLFLSSADGRVWTWNPGTPETLPVRAENCPSLAVDMLVTEERHVMVFGADGFVNRVAWSDQGNRAGWSYTNVTGQAGFFDLEGAGRIISAFKIPGAILVFTSTSVWVGRYIGQPYYYGFTKVAEGAVPISPQAVAVAGSRVFWMGIKSFWKFEGGVVTPLYHTLGADIFNNMHDVAQRRVCAGYNGLFPEIWWFYPTDDRDLEPLHIENDRYVIFNFDPGREWWADGIMGRSSYDTSAINNYPIAGSATTHILRQEVGFSSTTDANREVFAEVNSLSFDDGESTFSVHQCQIDDAGGVDAVEFDFRGQYVRGGPEYAFHEGLRGRADGYLDTRFTARNFSMRITGIKDVAWGLGAMIFSSVKRRGKR